MALGGKREGAGRKKGSTTKPRISDFLTPKDVQNLLDKAYELAVNGNETMLKFILEQNFGKAMQPVEGNFTGDISITFDNSFKNGASHTTPETN